MFGRGLAASAAALVLVASAGADERIFRLGLPADDAATAADTRDLALRGDDDAVTVEVRRGGYGGGGYRGGYRGGYGGGYRSYAGGYRNYGYGGYRNYGYGGYRNYGYRGYYGGGYRNYGYGGYYPSYSYYYPSYSYYYPGYSYCYPTYSYYYPSYSYGIGYSYYPYSYCPISTAVDAAPPARVLTTDPKIFRLQPQDAGDGTYEYDGGSAAPQAEPARKAPAPTVPLEGRVVSLKMTKPVAAPKYQSTAYGEGPGRASFAEDRTVTVTRARR